MPEHRQMNLKSPCARRRRYYSLVCSSGNDRRQSPDENVSFVNDHSWRACVGDRDFSTIIDLQFKDQGKQDERRKGKQPAQMQFLLVLMSFRLRAHSPWRR